MKTIKINCFGAKILFNALYEDCPLDFLTEDLLAIKYPPDGIILNVGWYPKSDPNGQYNVSINFGLEKSNSVSSKNLNEIVRIVEEFSQSYMMFVGTSAKPGN
jgi:hypothetical protein